MDTVFKLANGVSMPAVGFGTYQLSPDEAAEKAVRAALDIGYRHIDTAKLYQNEHGVGKAVRDSAIPREEIFVTTKLWNTDHAYDDAMQAIDASLDRLGLEYVDLYLIHWPQPGDRDTAWRALQDIYESGKAKAIGVSNYTVEHLEDLLDGSGMVPMANQIEFHPFIYAEQRGILDYCRQKNIAVEAYSPLRHDEAAEPAVLEIAKRLNKTPSQVVLRWCLQHGAAPLPRSANPAHIRENLEVFDFELTEDDMQVLDGLGG